MQKLNTRAQSVSFEELLDKVNEIVDAVNKLKEASK